MSSERVQGRTLTVLLVLLATALVLPSIITWLYFVTFAGHRLMAVIYAIGKTVQFSLPIIWFVGFARGELNRSLFRAAGTATGLAFGLAVAVLMILLYRFFFYKLGLFDAVRAQALERLAAVHLDSPAGYLGVAVFYSLVHSFLEEYYWRWFVYGQLRKLIPAWPAIVVSSVGFSAHHVIVLMQYFDEPWFVAFCTGGIVIGGAVWCLIYEKTRSLVGIWLSHLAVDAAIMAIGWDLVFRS